MQCVKIPLGPTHVPANLDIKEMDEHVLVRKISCIILLYSPDHLSQKVYLSALKRGMVAVCGGSESWD